MCSGQYLFLVVNLMYKNIKKSFVFHFLLFVVPGFAGHLNPDDGSNWIPLV
jgi:hypothetical protein